MKKTTFFALFTALTASVFAQEIEWDFSKGIKPNGPFEFVLKEPATIENGYLYINDPVDKVCRGAVYAKGKYPELSPKGAFSMTFVFTMEKARSPQIYQMLWDSKGDYYNKKSGKPLDNSGFTIAVYRPKTAKIMGFHIFLGNVKETSVLTTKRVPFELGKKYTMVFNYDGKSKYSVTLDGKSLADGTVAPGGPIGDAIYKPTIGNRAVGSFFPFDGKIYSVKMIKK